MLYPLRTNPKGELDTFGKAVSANRSIGIFLRPIGVFFVAQRGPEIRLGRLLSNVFHPPYYPTLFTDGRIDRLSGWRWSRVTNPWLTFDSFQIEALHPSTLPWKLPSRDPGRLPRDRAGSRSDVRPRLETYCRAPGRRGGAAKGLAAAAGDLACGTPPAVPESATLLGGFFLGAWACSQDLDTDQLDGATVWRHPKGGTVNKKQHKHPHAAKQP